MKENFYKLGGRATNFTDPQQPEPKNRSLSGRQVKALATTRRVNKAVKGGGLVKVERKDFDDFQAELAEERKILEAKKAEESKKKPGKLSTGELMAELQSGLMAELQESVDKMAKDQEKMMKEIKGLEKENKALKAEVSKTPDGQSGKSGAKSVAKPGTGSGANQ